jgi:hypothetical protein
MLLTIVQVEIFVTDKVAVISRNNQSNRIKIATDLCFLFFFLTNKCILMDRNASNQDTRQENKLVHSKTLIFKILL